MPHVKPAFAHLEKMVDYFRENLHPKSLLYVGWRYDGSPWWYDVFGKQLGIERFGVLEIFPKNISDLEQAIWSGRYDVTPISGDVRKIDSLVAEGDWDIIYWDHGPEHVSWQDLKECTPKILKSCGKMLLYSAPWGHWPQGEEDGNPNEVHRNSITREQFYELGIGLTGSMSQVITFGSPGQSNEGEICGWKIK